MEQMGLFSDITEEVQVYEILKPYLIEVLQHHNAGSENNLRIEKGKTYSSVNYIKFDPYDQTKEMASKLIFRICLRKGKRYFGVSDSLLCNENIDSYRISTVKPDKGFMYFDFDPTRPGILEYSGFLSSVVETYVYSIQKDFDCCAMFEQCSDAMRCILPNSAIATSCGYRKILREGKVFYGKNQNV